MVWLQLMAKWPNQVRPKRTSKLLYIELHQKVLKMWKTSSKIPSEFKPPLKKIELNVLFWEFHGHLLEIRKSSRRDFKDQGVIKLFFFFCVWNTYLCVIRMAYWQRMSRWNIILLFLRQVSSAKETLVKKSSRAVPNNPRFSSPRFFSRITIFCRQS